MKKPSIISILGTIAILTISNCIIYKKGKKKQTELAELADKHKDLFLMMNQWVKTKQEGKSIDSYLKNKGYKKIAIYGMSFVGETLLRELKRSEIEVKYGIDKNAKGIYADVNLVTLEDSFDEVDAIVVTAISYFDEIRKSISKKIDCDIVSLENILYDL